MQPGTIPFLDDHGVHRPELLDAMLELAIRRGGGQITGPKGSGKTTLLKGLFQVAGHRRMVRTLVRAPKLPRIPRKSVIFIDSAERYPAWVWHGLRLAIAGRGAIPIVTTHRPLGLYPLHTRSVSPVLAGKAIRYLHPPGVPAGVDLDALLEKHGGSLRDVFFDLYDAYETSYRGWPCG